MRGAPATPGQVRLGATRRLRRRAMAVLGGIALVLLPACASGGDASAAPVEIAGGDPSGVYYNYGAHLASAAQRELGLNIAVAETRGSVENLQRVGSGEADFGFAQGDTTVDAVVGQGSFGIALPIRSVARVYDEYVHIVVPEESDIDSLGDLVGHRVSLGAEGSGVQVIAGRVLEAAGVDPSSLTNAALGLDDSLAAMGDGRIEAFFWVGGLPTPGIERLRETVPLRLVPIGADVVEQVNEGHKGVYRTAEFPVGIYATEGSVITMTVPNYLITNASAPDPLVHDVLRVLFESRASIAQQVTSAGFLDRRQAIFTSPIELHPGAAEFYVASRR